MQINRVSFGNQDLSTLVAQPPATSSEAKSEMAATSLQEGAPDSFNGKTAVKAVVGLGIAAGVLAALRYKFGTFKNINLDAGIKAQESIMGKVKYAIAKAGQSVIDGAKNVQAIFSKKAKLSLKEEKLEKAKSDKIAAAKTLADAQEALSKAAKDVKGAAQKKVSDAEGKLNDINTKISNLEKDVNDLKANMNKAKGADKATEETPKAEA